MDSKAVLVFFFFFFFFFWSQRWPPSDGGGGGGGVSRLNLTEKPRTRRGSDLSITSWLCPNLYTATSSNLPPNGTIIY